MAEENSYAAEIGMGGVLVAPVDENAKADATVKDIDPPQINNEPTEDTKPTEKQDNIKVESPTPDLKTDDKKPPEDKPTETPEYISKLKEFTGQEFTSEDDVKNYFTESTKKLSEVEKLSKAVEEGKTQKAAYDELVKYLDENRDKHDPKNTMFGGDEEKMKRFMIGNALTKAGKNPDVVGKLLSADLGTMSPLELISLSNQLESKFLSGKDTEVKRMILKDIGVDIDDEDFNISNPTLTSEQKTALELKAGKIEIELQGAIDGVEIPEISDPVKNAYDLIETRNSKTKELTEAWSNEGVAKSLGDSLDNVEILGTQFEINSEEKAKIVQEMVLDAALHGYDVTDENKQTLIAAAKYQYIRDHVEQILSVDRQQREAELKEDFDKKTYNAKPINTNEAVPASGDSKQKLEDALKRQNMI